MKERKEMERENKFCCIMWVGKKQQQSNPRSSRSVSSTVDSSKADRDMEYTWDWEQWDTSGVMS